MKTLAIILTCISLAACGGGSYHQKDFLYSDGGAGASGHGCGKGK